MIDKMNDQFMSELDTDRLNERISNDQFFETKATFEPSHSISIIEKLVHLSRFGNLLTLVVGSNGCGKTWLLGNFLAAVDETSQVCHIKAQPLLSIDQLFQQVIQSFTGDTTFTGIPTTASQYEDWVNQLAVIPGKSILVIDDAEVLSTSVLQELCKLSAIQQEKESPCLQLILFGNHDLNNTIEQASQGVLEDDDIYTIDIPALDEVDARQWLEFLFEKSGVVFFPERDELEKMLSKGRGNIAQLEEFADEFTAISHEMHDFGEEPESGKISVLGYWSAIFTTILILVLGGFFFQKEITQLTGFGSDQAKLELPIVQEPLNVEPEPEPELEPESKFEPEAEIKPDQEPESIFEPVSELGAEPETLEIVTQQTEEALANQQTETKQEPVPEPVSVVEPKAEQPNLSKDEQFLMSASDDHYAVQIIGLSKEASVKSFIAKTNLPNMLYYRSRLKSKPLYIVVLATYQSRADVNAARNNLPSELVKHGPWIKKLKYIKDEISPTQP